MRAVLLFALASLTPMLPVAVMARSESVAQMKARWEVLHDRCKDHGGPSCRYRDQLTQELMRRGVCYAYSDSRVITADYTWHPCSQPRPRGWRPN